MEKMYVCLGRQEFLRSITLEDQAQNLGVNVNDVSADLQRDVNAVVVNGSELREMTPTQIEHILTNFRDVIFARITPQQKLLIIDGCQKLGNTVAALGDTVYDRFPIIFPTFTAET